MMFWMVIAAGFLVCFVAWYSLPGITKTEAITLFLSTAILFGIMNQQIYNEATTDHYLITGRVTSLTHHPAYTYHQGKKTYHIKEGFIVEQRPYRTTINRHITYKTPKGNATVECWGECFTKYYGPPYSQDEGGQSQAYSYSVAVNALKFSQTQIGDPSVVWRSYFNPVQVSNEVVYNNEKSIPYFDIVDYNQTTRIIAPHVDEDDQRRLDRINAELAKTKISLGLIVTSDALFFEKIKRAWHHGKANDFIVVVDSPDGKTIRNVNVLCWNNYNLVTNVTQALSGLNDASVDKILTILDDALKAGPVFQKADFKNYSYVNVQIPEKYYVKLFLFYIAFFAYILFLLSKNPNTKDFRLPWKDVAKMWDKKFRPPQKNWFLHPFTPIGIVLYFALPAALEIFII